VTAMTALGFNPKKSEIDKVIPFTSPNVHLPY